MQDVIDKAKAISLLILDVDGVLTDGHLHFSNTGDELKSFHIQDGLGIKLLHDNAIAVAIITGRQSNIVNKRATELNIQHVIQGREDKLKALEQLRAQLNLQYHNIAYAGDDLPDLSAIRAAGLGITVANGHRYVAEHADWQTQARGGEGAVREICELILHAQDKLLSSWSSYL
jgi:3-deoxy-D-manno-octulosonate 8-phosphate phosphatase (KDO 8-P phosphatase)